MNTRPLRRSGSQRRALAPRPLPVRQGLGPSSVVLPPGPWPTVLDFLCERFAAIERAQWLARMAAGEVLDGEGRPVTPEQPCVKQTRLWYYRSLNEETPIPFEAQVLFQDDRLVVADKPHFLPVLPSGRYVEQTLLVRLRRQLGIDTLTPIHRIDRGTAGLVLFAVQATQRGAYHALFAQRAVHKCYEAIVHWPSDAAALPARYLSRLEAQFMRSVEVPGPANAETGLELLRAQGARAHLRLTPQTGRKHQLRAHCAALGMPIVNDDIYPLLLPQAPADFSRPLQLLARELAFEDPIDGQARHFKSLRTLQGLEGLAASND